MCLSRHPVLGALFFAAIAELSPSFAGAQRPADQVCTAPAASGPLGTSLPIDVLNFLDTRSQSAFVHAFLIGYVADHGARAHWLTECARTFLGDSMTNPAKLRSHLPPAATLINALREAEDTRLSDAAKRSTTAGTVMTVLAELQRTGAASRLTPYLESLRAAKPGCTSGSAFCKKLGNALPLLETADTARNLANAVATQLAAKGDSLVTVRSLPALNTAGGSSADLSVVDTAKLRKDIGQLTDSVAKLKAAAQAATTNAVDALVLLARSDSTTFISSISKVYTSAFQDVGGLLSSAPPAAPAPIRVQVAQSNGLVGAISDYVIDQARQELIYYSLMRVYLSVREDGLLASAFPESFALMKGLTYRTPKDTTPADVRASVFAAVPLSVWRATFMSDYGRLPVTLFAVSAPLFCGEGNGDCNTALERLRPAVSITQRLLRGDGAMTVLSDLPDSLVPALGTSLEQRRLGQGLMVLGTIAATYYDQGGLARSDSLRQPYMLSAQALMESPRSQRDAFTRLLLLRAAKVDAGSFASLDTAQLANAIRATSEAVEAIISHSQPAELTPAQASTNFARTSAAFSLALVVSSSLDASLAPRFQDIRHRWAQFGDIVDPLVARNFGLALSRTTVMYREVANRQASPALLRIAALGANLADAQDAAQVRDAFAAVSPPMFGYESKRYREDDRMSITAFVGGGGGMERPLPGGVGATAYPFIPIGFHKPLGVSTEKVGVDPACPTVVFCSWAFFLPVIDLGAPLTWHTGNGDLSLKSSSGFEQVIAPGLYLDLGIRRTPVSFLVGAQYLPYVRRSTTPDADATSSAFRVGVALAADVTLLKM